MKLLADEVENDIMMKSFCGDKFYEKSIPPFSRRIITDRYLSVLGKRNKILYHPVFLYGTNTPS